MSVDGRGRDEDFSSPPAQIPACAANAPGSHPHPLLPELSGVSVGARDFFRLLMCKLAFNCVGMSFAAFVQRTDTVDRSP
jgi:hypothetical protein